jgi:AcrR family transcriptional regulator
MARATQKRALETRASLIAAADALAKVHGYEGLRVEEIVAEAGVAKGTFFKHFGDKDGLMETLIAAQLQSEIARLAEIELPPTSVEGVVETLSPLHHLMTRERYVFDIVVRYSGAVAIAEIGPMAMVFGDYLHVVGKWMTAGYFRPDITPHLAAEGVQAFAVQAMALEFCALHTSKGRDARLIEYLRAWLRPGR